MKKRIGIFLVIIILSMLCCVSCSKGKEILTNETLTESQQASSELESEIVSVLDDTEHSNIVTEIVSEVEDNAYTQLNESHHWVDDSNSKYYNRFVSTNEVEVDWLSSEHLYKVVPQYNYVLSISYNDECISNKGSAIFLHCTSRNFGPTAGCVAIPEEYMIQVIKRLQSDCIIIIDDSRNIMNY